MDESGPRKDKEYLEITPDGRIRLFGDATQRELLSRIGRWELLQTGPDLTCFHRLPEGLPRLRIPPGRVVLSGDLGAFFSPVELLSFLQTIRATSWVFFSSGAVHRMLILLNGDLLAVQSNQSGDRLGEILHRYGLVDQERVASALPEVGPGRPLGRILVERGDLGANDLWEGIRHQMEDVFFEVISMRAGGFLVIDAGVEEFPTRMSLSTRRLIFEGLKRFDELEEFRKLIPSDDLVVALAEGGSRDPDMDPGVVAVLDQVVRHGPATIRQLTRISRLGPHMGLKAIHTALRSGVLRIAS